MKRGKIIRKAIFLLENEVPFPEGVKTWLEAICCYWFVGMLDFHYYDYYCEQPALTKWHLSNCMVLHKSLCILYKCTVFLSRAIFAQSPYVFKCEQTVVQWCSMKSKNICPWKGVQTVDRSNKEWCLNLLKIEFFLLKTVEWEEDERKLIFRLLTFLCD